MANNNLPGRGSSFAGNLTWSAAFSGNPDNNFGQAFRTPVGKEMSTGGIRPRKQAFGDLKNTIHNQQQNVKETPLKMFPHLSYKTPAKLGTPNENLFNVEKSFSPFQRIQGGDDQIKKSTPRMEKRTQKLSHHHVSNKVPFLEEVFAENSVLNDNEINRILYAVSPKKSLQPIPETENFEDFLCNEETIELTEKFQKFSNDIELPDVELPKISELDIFSDLNIEDDHIINEFLDNFSICDDI